MSPEVIVNDMLPLYRRLSTDDQDSVRLLTVQDLVAMAEKLGPAETQQLLLPSICATFQDKSWRVRYMAADHFVQLASAVDENVIKEDLVPAFINLMRDAEAEVRTAAAGQIPGLAKLLDHLSSQREPKSLEPRDTWLQCLRNYIIVCTRLMRMLTCRVRAQRNWYFVHVC